MDKKDLLKMINDDEFDILKLNSAASSPVTADDRLIQKFKEINRFIKKNNREPLDNADIQEHSLYQRLKRIRKNKDQVEALLEFDKHGLLQKKTKEITSLDDIYDDDSLNILDNSADNIFHLKHIPSVTSKTLPDYIATRKTCTDFQLFEPLFKQCQIELASKKRSLLPFNSDIGIQEGMFFVLNGILLYVADIGEWAIINDRHNARTHCIFENGTESDMLFLSLEKMLYKNGRYVTESTHPN